MASMTTANARCARFGADKKTLLSGKRAGFNGGARRVQVAKGGACRARGHLAVRAAGSAFIPEEFQSPDRKRKVVLPGDPEFDRARGVAGLSAKQIEVMGLGPDQAFRRPDVDPFSISARASYRNEMPCEANGGPASMVSAIAGAGSGGYGMTMSAGGGSGGARGSASTAVTPAVPAAPVLLRICLRSCSTRASCTSGCRCCRRSRSWSSRSFCS